MPRRDDPRQLGLFGEVPSPAGAAAPRASVPRSAEVVAAAVDPEVRALAARIPAEIRLGTSSWSFPGWAGLVYAERYSEARLARHGLAAYALHPLFRTVGIDRSFYAPVTPEEFAAYAAVVPDDFQFAVKALQAVTSPSLLSGGRREKSPYFLDAAYAADVIVAPFVGGLGPKAGPLVFQFVPLSQREIGQPGQFAERLHEFLNALPPGPLYAVELRNEDLLTPRYAEVLRDTRCVHCFNIHPTMPPIARQLAAVGEQTTIVARWMLNSRFNYEEARETYAPFDRLVDEDEAGRAALADLATGAASRKIRVYVLANNKAEGSSPWSVRLLGERIVQRMTTSPG